MAMASWRGTPRSAQNEREDRETSLADIPDPPGVVLASENILDQAHQEYGQGIEELNSGKSRDEIDHEVVLHLGALLVLAEEARKNDFGLVAAITSCYADRLTDCIVDWQQKLRKADARPMAENAFGKRVEVVYSVDLDLPSPGQFSHLQGPTDTQSVGLGDGSMCVDPHLLQLTSQMGTQLPLDDTQSPPHNASHICVQPSQDIPQSRRRETPETSKAPRRKKAQKKRTASKRGEDGGRDTSDGITTHPLCHPLPLIMAAFMKASFAAQSDLEVPKRFVSEFNDQETQIQPHISQAQIQLYPELKKVLKLVNSLRIVMDRFDCPLSSTLIGESNPLNIQLLYNPSGGAGKVFCNECRKAYNRYRDFTRHHISEHMKLLLISCQFCPRKFRRPDLGQKHVGRKHVQQVQLAPNSTSEESALTGPTGILAKNQIMELDESRSFRVEVEQQFEAITDEDEELSEEDDIDDSEDYANQ